VVILRGAIASAAVVTIVVSAACSNPETDRIKKNTIPTYDKNTGKLTELTYDSNKNGRIDTWTDMDGTRPLRSRIDLDEDGKIDRWEYYDEKGGLAKVGFSRKQNGKPDAWAYSAPDGKLARVEISSTGDDTKIDRWEFYEGGGLSRAEEDTDGNGKVDKWETYVGGALKTASMDEDGDGLPDRRLTYVGGALVLIESVPDASGRFTKRVEVK
jgi:hypothetical protein